MNTPTYIVIGMALLAGACNSDPRRDIGRAVCDTAFNTVQAEAVSKGFDGKVLQGDFMTLCLPQASSLKYLNTPIDPNRLDAVAWFREQVGLNDFYHRMRVGAAEDVIEVLDGLTDELRQKAADHAKPKVEPDARPERI